MRKSQKILAGLFLGGVLLGGIGTGIALVEYSSLTYAGEKEIGQEHLVVQELDYTFAPDEEQVCIVRGYQDRDAVVKEDMSVPEGTVRYVVTYNKKTIKPALSFWEEQEETEITEIMAAEPEDDQEYEEDGDDQEDEDNREQEAEEEGGETVQERIAAESPEGDDDLGATFDEAVIGSRPKKKMCLRLVADYIGSDFGLLMENKDKLLEDLKEKRISTYHVAYITHVEILVNPRTLPNIEGWSAGAYYNY